MGHKTSYQTTKKWSVVGFDTHNSVIENPLGKTAQKWLFLMILVDF